ncbi:flagellar biosynthesis sigma factor [Curvibacter sp. CHRR-16]|uniref:flagellar biosynthesis sigma factor n=1 Tax=Curvibacter sp. CHRR-16 TaxID=2835872 RepID=UPI001BDA2442|nr:flagellar biosynthesis sigma factor [Curvibacter sp. CHRR-16]MBT0569018.1 flagellar biosynthesis sigma factor [Curvibacter sp. CHRR-16]
MKHVLNKWVLSLVLGFVLAGAIGVGLYVHAQSGVPEVALKLGEPWEDMRKRSSAKIDPTITDTSAFGIIEGDARMRFVDDQYGFVTPRAKFLTVSYDSQKVASVRMSPQVETLPLDEALKVVLDLQQQWERGGWKHVEMRGKPPFENTPQWRENLTNCKPNTNYWYASNLYQVQLSLDCFDDSKYPNQNRYLITLELAKLGLALRESQTSRAESHLKMVAP